MFAVTRFGALIARGRQRLLEPPHAGWDKAELARREANQIPIEHKSRLSNLVVSNDSTLEALRKKIDFAWEKLATMGLEQRSARQTSIA